MKHWAKRKLYTFLCFIHRVIHKTGYYCRGWKGPCFKFGRPTHNLVTGETDYVCEACEIDEFEDRIKDYGGLNAKT